MFSKSKDIFLFKNLFTIASDGDRAHTSMPEGEIQLKEVEEQLQNIFTPTPIELLKVSLTKARDRDDFGFSLSDGVFEKGVYVSAIRPGGPASSKLKPFDRILQVRPFMLQLDNKPNLNKFNYK